MPGYTACTACPAHAAQASHQFPTFQPVLHQLPNLRVAPHHTSNTCSQQPGTPGYTACTAAQPVLHQLPNLHLAPHQTLEAEHLQLAARLAGLYQTSEAEHLQLAARHARLYSLHSLSSPRSPDQSQFPTCQAVRQLPNLHLKPHETLEAEHLQLAARHARLYSLHSLSSPRSPDQSQFPTCQAARQLPNLHLKPHQTLEAEHLQLAARHARLYSLHSLSSPRSPGQSQFPTFQPVLHQLPNLRLAPHHTLEAEHLQPAARHARLYSLHSLSSPRSPASAPPTPKFAPQTSPDLGSRTPAASSQACQAIQPAQPAQTSHSSRHVKQCANSSPDLGSRTPAPSSQACQALQPAQPVQPRSPDQSQFPTCQAVRQLPNLHLKPHQTLEAEHLQLAARHARLYSLHSLSSPRSPDRSQFPTCQAVHQLPNLHLKTDQSLEAEHLQLAARHARLYSLRSLSSLRSPGQSPVPHISTSSPPTSSQARQAIQPAQPVQPTQPRPVTVPDMSAVHQLQTCTSNLTTECSQLAATYEA